MSSLRRRAIWLGDDHIDALRVEAHRRRSAGELTATMSGVLREIVDEWTAARERAA